MPQSRLERLICVSIRRLPSSVPDIVEQHKHQIKTTILIVHTHTITIEKIHFMFTCFNKITPYIKIHEHRFIYLKKSITITINTILTRCRGTM